LDSLNDDLAVARTVVEQRVWVRMDSRLYRRLDSLLMWVANDKVRTGISLLAVSLWQPWIIEFRHISILHC
jgi:hypothetical protein